MALASSQKFIQRNRAPRVQIEYDVELYGAEKKIQLPFVMGVLADLSGKPEDPLAPVPAPVEAGAPTAVRGRVQVRHESQLYSGDRPRCGRVAHSRRACFGRGPSE